MNLCPFEYTFEGEGAMHDMNPCPVEYVFEGKEVMHDARFNYHLSPPPFLWVTKVT